MVPWGFNFFLNELTHLPRFAMWAKRLSDAFNRFGFWLAIALAVLVFVQLRRRELGWGKSIAAGLAVFLIFTPWFPLKSDLPVAAPIAAIAWMCLWLFVARAIHIEIRGGKVIFIFALMIGLIARELLAWFSIGSADAAIFRHFAEQIDTHGLLWLYRNEVGFNHPPFSGLWARCALNMAGFFDAHVAARWSWFPFTFKQPMIFADLAACGLLSRIWKDRKLAPALFAISPLAILLSGFHGNTDPLYAMLVLLAGVLIWDRAAFFWAGIALGCAINVKFIPVLFIPILAALCRDRKQFMRFISGLAVMSIPFIPLVVLAPGALFRNVMSYASTSDYWGINQFVLEALRSPQFSAPMQAIEESFHNHGRWLVLGAIVLLIIRMRKQRWDSSRAIDAIALAAAIFMILTPGFAMQYLALPGLLLFAVRVVPATVFAIAAGLYILFNYWLNWVGGAPIDAFGIAAPVRAPGAQFGLVAWFALIVFVAVKIGGKQENHEP